MEATTVIAILDSLEDARVDAWVDGGWGVDALLGRQTRTHDDLDLVVALDRASTIQEVLGKQGFVLVEDNLPVRFVLAHSEVGRVDFHTVTFDSEGGGIQPQPTGKAFRYPPEGFVVGAIAGRSVRCVSAEVQVLCHLGYEPKEKDARDVLALHRTFGIRLPRAYERFLEEG